MNKLQLHQNTQSARHHRNQPVSSGLVKFWKPRWKCMCHQKLWNLEVGQHHSRSCRDFQQHSFHVRPTIFHYFTACGRLDTLPARAVVRWSTIKRNRCILLRILVLIKLSILQSEDPARLLTTSICTSSAGNQAAMRVEGRRWVFELPWLMEKICFDSSSQFLSVLLIQ